MYSMAPEAGMMAPTMRSLGCHLVPVKYVKLVPACTHMAAMPCERIAAWALAMRCEYSCFVIG